MIKPSHVLTRKYMGAVININNYHTDFTPNYNVVKKLIDAAILDPLSAHLPKSSRTLLTEHGYNMETVPSTVLSIRANVRK